MIAAYIIIVFAIFGVFSLVDKMYHFYRDYRIKKDIEDFVQSLTEEDIKEMIRKDKEHHKG